jgi:hypothetical protein
VEGRGDVRGVNSNREPGLAVNAEDVAVEARTGRNRLIDAESPSELIADVTGLVGYFDLYPMDAIC